VRAIVVAALIGTAAALLAPAASQAATPCWQRLLDDWSGGRIDGDYAAHCYRDALAHLPEDLRVYGTAETDIQRALARKLAEHAAPTPRSSVVATKPRTKTTSKAAPRPQRRTLEIHTQKRPKVRRVAAPVANASPSSFPVKLAVVLGIAALVAAVTLASWRRTAAVRRRRQLP
jgi:hypothetical protein